MAGPRLIPGVQGVIAPLVYVKRQQLSEAAYATVEDALYSLPITSCNGPREDLGLDNNYQYGAGIDLRGLGVGATLVLVDGHRQPLSGGAGDFVDVSTIPWLCACAERWRGLATDRSGRGRCCSSR